MKKALAWMGRHWIITVILVSIASYSVATYEPRPDEGQSCAEIEDMKLKAWLSEHEVLMTLGPAKSPCAGDEPINSQQKG